MNEEESEDLQHAGSSGHEQAKHDCTNSKCRAQDTEEPHTSSYFSKQIVETSWQLEA